MKNKIDKRIPRYGDLIMPTFTALKELGGSGKNSEILEQIIKDLEISDEVAFIMQLGALLEDLTVAKARAGIEKIVHLTPQTARVIRNGKEEILPAEQVKVLH